MANINIQMKNRNGASWDDLYPLSIDSNIFDSKGVSMDKTIKTINTGLEQRVGKGELIISVKDYGAIGDGVTDNTSVYNKIINEVPEGSTILFPKGVFKGNFISNKAFTLDFQGSTIIPVGNESPVKFEGDYSLAERSIVGTPLKDGLYIEVSSNTGLNVDDIVYMYDESTRPGDSTPGINVELLRIKKIDGTRIYFYDIIRSRMNTGLVKLKKIDTLKLPKVYDVKVEDTLANMSPLIYFKGCEYPVAEGVETINSYGHAVRFENCISYKASDIRVVKPIAVGSGQGYGVTSVKSRDGVIYNIYGNKTRHVVDLMSSFNVYIEKIKEDESLEAVVVLSHNGYGGNIHVKDVIAVTDGYAVSWSSQGVADLSKQVIDDVTIRDIQHIYPTKTPSVFCISIYLQLDYKNILIDGVKTTFLNDGAIISDGSKVVRLNGNPMGNFTMKNIYCKKIAVGIQAESRTNYTDYNFNFTVENFVIDSCLKSVWLRGIYQANIRGIKTRFEPIENLIVLDTYNSVKPTFINVAGDVDIPVKFMGGNASDGVGLKGKLETRTDYGGSSLTVSNGMTISRDRVLKSGGYLELTSPVGADAILNATTPIESPLWVGQELLITVNGIGNTGGTRGNVIIPAGTTTYADSVGLTLEKGRIYRLIGYNGRWIRQS